MKKLIALLLAALMMMSCVALADTTNVAMDLDESITVTMVLPEGYTYAANVGDDGILSMQIIKDEDSLNAAIAVAADGDYDETERLNDLTDAQKAEFAAMFIEDMDEDEPWSIKTTGYGSEVIVIEEAEGEYDLAILVSMYHGYDIVMYVGYQDGRMLTDDDIALAMQFLTDMQFETKIPEAA